LTAERWHKLLTSEAVEKMRVQRSAVLGAPVAMTWLELLEQLT